MKVLSIFSSLCLLFLVSCSEKILKEECPDVICTMEFRSIPIHFKDASGKSISVKNFSAVIRRTGESTLAAKDTINNNGNYLVVSDSDTKNLSEKGDTIDVSATNPLTNQRKTVQLVVKGGRCACHIEKVSGPEEVVFDNIPACVQQMIENIKSQPVTNPASSVWQYNFKGQMVYFIPQYCCDIPSKLLDANCNLICKPDGGFTGKGDGKCTDFVTERTDGKLIWKDDRK